MKQYGITFARSEQKAVAPAPENQKPDRRKWQEEPSCYVGQKFGRLTIQSLAGRGKTGHIMFNCICECGNKKVVMRARLHSGHTKSCGCLSKEVTQRRATIHGFARVNKIQPEFRAWAKAKDRCINPNDAAYERYGGRGIRMCERWLNSFSNFIADMGRRPPGKSIERKNNNGNYEPGNCIWADRRTQNNNTRTNVFLTFKGRTMTAAQWSREFNVVPDTIYLRIKKGWPIEMILQPSLR